MRRVVVRCGSASSSERSRIDMVAVVRMRDKGMTISEIARRLRISKDRICSAINAAGVSGSSRRRTKEYWLRIDWKRPNAEIAVSESVSKAWIATLRAMLRAAQFRVCESPRRPGPPIKWTPERAAAIDWRISDRELACRLGLKVSTVRGLRARLRKRGVRIPDPSRVDRRIRGVR